jgi:hypothetical protein
MHHVRTQAPYALLVGSVSIVTGDLMGGYLYPSYAGLIITIFVVLVIGYFLSAPVEGNKLDPVNAFMNKTGELLYKVFSRKRADGKMLSESSSSAIAKEASGSGDAPAEGGQQAAT